MSKDNQYDLTDVANALSIIMTSDKTPTIIHDSIVDRLADLESIWAKKHTNDYDPEHLMDVLNDELDRELENEQKSEPAAETEVVAGGNEGEEVWASSEDLDATARVLSKILKGGFVSEEVRSHLGDFTCQLENDLRNETVDFDSEEAIKATLRGYFLNEEAAA